MISSFELLSLEWSESSAPDQCTLYEWLADYLPFYISWNATFDPEKTQEPL